MKKILYLILIFTLLCSVTVTAYADDIADPSISTPEGSDLPVEPSEPENNTSEPTEPEKPSESTSEPSEPEEPGESNTEGSENASEPSESEEPGETVSEPSEPETPTVNVSEESIQAIADAIVGEGTFTIVVGGYTLNLKIVAEDNYYYDAQQEFFRAWNNYNYKLVSIPTTGNLVYSKIFFFNEEPGEADYIDSSGKWFIRGCAEWFECYVSIGKNEISNLGWHNQSVREVEVFPNGITWSNFHVMGQGGVVLHESDTPITNWVSFNTGFDDLIIDDMSTLLFNPPTPLYEGYRFEGWYFDPEYIEPYTLDYKFTEDITLYAKWSPYVTVTIVTGLDDYIVEPIQVISGEPFYLPGFSYPDYQFKGAYTAEDFGASSQFYDGSVITEDITLYLWFEKLDSTALLRQLTERMEGLVYVQIASIIMLIACSLFIIFFNRRHG